MAETPTETHPKKDPVRRRTAATAGAVADTGTPIPIPSGVDTALTVEQIQVRRQSPVLPAVRYTGANAVQVAAWLHSHGRDCTVTFPTTGTPVLTTPQGEALATGWVLPNLEVLSEQDLTGVYEKV